jgi:predicted nucleic acid-binding protein
VILVDSSIWIDHLRRPEAELERLLSDALVICHPFVIGELACGHLRSRGAFLEALADLAMAPAATHVEAMGFVERHALAGRGIGWTDVHLLASTALMPTAMLWTRDKRLAAAAAALRLVYEPPAQ